MQKQPGSSKWSPTGRNPWLPVKAGKTLSESEKLDLRPNPAKRVSDIKERELEEIPVMSVEDLYTMETKQSRQMSIRH